MIIRSKQMEAFESAAEENFVRRLTEHLVENYAEAIVRLPDQESAVDNLPKETLDLLVRRSIERARRYDLSFESSISAFSAMMFEVAPNFDNHSMSRLCLNDANIEPNDRLDELLKLLTEKHWEKIKTDYDVNSWLSDDASAIEPENVETPKNTASSDFAETVMNIENTEKPAPFVPVGNSDFAETVMNIDTPNKTDKPASEENFDFLDTIINIDLTKE
jgi:hypothetical protein